ncbi:hypothetical protein ADICYQ_0237 [Cyclobacterium qasimii M12-11B]|uniref:Uncharacterized protein n=1 Tax=Cyclobacterium qasimii M12-11B TaxID=641524 RepID=S7WXR9_9BACT|nr:hypothetical protein ADICYQ_0237 [Cyclobacterium qasimii M12-11B]
METVLKVMFSIQGLFWGTCLIILIYLIFRRISIKKTEDFEDRNN